MFEHWIRRAVRSVWPTTTLLTVADPTEDEKKYLTKQGYRFSESTTYLAGFSAEQAHAVYASEVGLPRGPDSQDSHGSLAEAVELCET